MTTGAACRRAGALFPRRDGDLSLCGAGAGTGGFFSIEWLGLAPGGLGLESCRGVSCTNVSVNAIP